MSERLLTTDTRTEIRNAIYAAICESVSMTTTPWTKKPMANYLMSIDNYSDFRPFAMLRANSHVQDEIYSFFFPKSHPINSEPPFGILQFDTTMRIECVTSHSEPFDMMIVAHFNYHDTDYKNLAIAFHVPEVFKMTDETYALVKETLNNIFGTEERFTVLQLLIAIDSVLTLDVTLSRRNPKDEDPKPKGVNIGSLDDETTEIVVFELVMERGDNGVMEITRKTRHISGTTW